MRKETVITAAVFLAVGFLAGYIYDSERNWSRQELPASPSGRPASLSAQPGQASGGAAAAEETPGAGEAAPPASGPAAQGNGVEETGAAGQALPPGHPTLAVAGQMKDLEDQASRNPEDPGPPLKLANLFFDQRMFEQAVTWYEHALKLDPKNVNAHTDLGTAYFNLGRSTEALAEYKKSLEIDSTHEPTMHNMIIVNLEGLHDPKAARAAWEKLYRRNPNYAGLAALKDRLGPGVERGTR